MSQFSIYLEVPDYLSGWLRHQMWDNDTQRVAFPKNSAETLVMSLFLAKRPLDVIDLPGTGKIPIKLPSVAGKNPAVYNWLSPSAQRALLGTIKKRFKVMMWEELHAINPDDVQITDLIYAFLDRHGIEPTEKNWETVRQLYFRMRKSYRKNNQEISLK